MARKGPVTKDTSTVALGLAQIRVGDSATNIGADAPTLLAADSIGALANTRFVGNTDWFKLESGFPLIEDFTTPVREAGALECSFKEITPANIALAYGLDPNSGEFAGMTVHSGEIPLGNRYAPDYVRMEAVYTYPNAINHMYIIFPRAQVSANVEMDLQSEDAAAVPITFESKRADSEMTGGNAMWDDKPLGHIAWD